MGGMQLKVDHCTRPDGRVIFTFQGFPDGWGIFEIRMILLITVTLHYSGHFRSIVRSSGRAASSHVKVVCRRLAGSTNNQKGNFKKHVFFYYGTMSTAVEFSRQRYLPHGTESTGENEVHYATSV